MSGRWACGRAAQRCADGPGWSCAATSSKAFSGAGPCSSSTRARSPRSAPTSSPPRPTSRRCSRGCVAPTPPARLGETLIDQTPRRRDREHVDGRDALAGPALAVAPPRRRYRGRPPERPRAAARGCAPPSTPAASRAGRPTGGPAGHAPAAGRRSARGDRATRTAPPTGARPASPGRRPVARLVMHSWRFGHRTSTSPCARSASRRSPPSGAPSCRSPSRSTRPGVGRPSTSTARSCGASSRSRLRRCAGSRHAQCDRRPAARAGGGDLRARPLGARLDRRRRALPDDSPADARRGRRARGRLRLEGRRLRERVRLDRAVALRHRPLLRRDCAADRPLRRAGRDLGGDIRVRAVVPGELSGLWPEALGLMPPEFGRDVDRLCVLELSRELDASEGEPPDAAAELADAVSALRLATAGAIAAGPVVFERLDFRPLRISPLLPIAATRPLGEAIRLDAVRARVAADLRERLPLADEDRELGEALDRWELSLFADEPFRSGQVKDALAALLGTATGPGPPDARRGALAGEREDRVELLRPSAPIAPARRPATRSAGARRDAPPRPPRPARRDARRDAARRAAAAGQRAGRVASPSHFAPSWHRHGTGSPLPSVHGRSGAVLERLERIRELNEATRPPGCCWRSCASSSSEAEEWARAEGDARARAAAAELGADLRGGGGEAARARRKRAVKERGSRARNERKMAVARLLPRPSLRLSAKAKAPAHTQVIALANQKGGVAKTTTTLNLGVAFGEGPARPLHRPRSTGEPDDVAGHEPRHDRALDVRRARSPAPDHRGDRDARDRLAVASIDLAGADMALSTQIGRERALQKAVEPIKRATTTSSSTPRRRSGC